MAKENHWQEALDEIDISTLESLQRIKQDQDLLDERIKAMDALKSTVATAVYLRVFEDYQGRCRALEDQAAPQKQMVRAEFAKLRVLLSRFEADHEAIKLDQQELELRHKLGEFDNAEYAKRAKSIEKSVMDKTTAHERAQALKQRFLAAFRSESDLEPSVVPKPKAAIIEQPDSPVEFPPDAGTNEVPVVTMPVPPNQTQVMQAINQPEGVTVQIASSKESLGNTTMVFRAARLVPQNAEAGKVTYTLSLKSTNIGADSANEIRIGGPGVEAKHAQITVSMGGFTLIDMNSKHGTRINAEKVRERVLRHEDVIQIGAARFVFREG